MFPGVGETLANLCQAARRHIPEGGHLRGHRLLLKFSCLSLRGYVVLMPVEKKSFRLIDSRNLDLLQAGYVLCLTFIGVGSVLL
jgi:hypothetical protein